ncbi:hypothetical protein XENOCAPTIV_001986 [Xenoophorus captivus]|uniref:Uncharacterized protein n=1 Tax=Xenoophorus captivus TaxID=1517983 RepID=A0ABV0Q7G7_9TELE
MGLVPPTFPVTMGIPPPGYGPPPPFLRPGFNASQPPPGFMQAPHTAGIASATTSLVQPSVASSQDAVMPPTSSIPGSFLPSAIPGAGVFTPVGVQNQTNSEKIPPSGEGMDAAAELTLQGMQNAVRSGMGLLGMHPSASLPHPLHQTGLSAPRMPGLLPIDVRTNLLQPGAARFPLLMQQGPPQQAAGLLDNSLHPRPRAPFPQMDPFNRAPNLPNENVSKTEDESSSGADEGKDQDYRFPPMEKPSTGLLPTPPPEHREPVGGGGGVPGGGRPPLLQTPGTQAPRSSLVGRLQALAGFTPDNRWSQSKGDFDERDGIRAGPQPPGGPKGFQDERPPPGQNFPNRFDNRQGVTGGPTGVNAGHVGGPQPWNRGGGPTPPFSSEHHKDLDDRRRPWERQRDRDERDFDFRRDVNGNRHNRERERERGRERPRESERDRDHDKEKDRGGWTPLLPLPTPLLPTPPLNPNMALNQGKLLAPLKLNPQVPSLFQSSLLHQGQAKPPLLSQPPPQVQIRPHPASQNPPPVSGNRREAQGPAEIPQAKSPSAGSPHQSSDSKTPRTLSEPPTQSEASQPEGPPQVQSPPQPIAQVPTESIDSPDTKRPHHDSPLGFSQADSPQKDWPHYTEKQEEPQKQEKGGPERSPTTEPQWVNGPGQDSVDMAEPTPEASPEPESTPGPGPASDSSQPQSETQLRQEQLSSPKDLNNEQNEPQEDAPSQPVVDTVTDTEGT